MSDADDQRQVRDRPAPDRRGATDAALIARSIVDPRAFSGIFDRHWERLRTFCRSRAGEVGEDLAAETFRVAFDQRERFDGLRDDAAPWLYGIATNLLRNHFRSSSRGRRAMTRLVGATASDEADDALRRVEAQQLGPALADALASLSAGERDALLLYAWEDLTYDEIACALGVAVGTISSRMSRARAAMQQQLAPIPTTSKDLA